jgi:SOS-response transcriptional repressor LexA
MKAYSQIRQLTDAQAAALECLTNFVHKHGRAPSVRELASILGVTVGSASRRLAALVAYGAVVRHDGMRFKHVPATAMAALSEEGFDLTDRQAACLNQITAHVERYGVAPTSHQLSAVLGRLPGNIEVTVRLLIARGKLPRDYRAGHPVVWPRREEARAA